jgi:hypothetical protein
MQGARLPRGLPSNQYNSHDVPDRMMHVFSLYTAQSAEETLSKKTRVRRDQSQISKHLVEPLLLGWLFIFAAITVPSRLPLLFV